jgi:hypothetical protein
MLTNFTSKSTFVFHEDTKKIEKWKNNHLFYGDGIRESVDDPQKKTAFFQEKYESLIKVDRTDLYLGLNKKQNTQNF